MDAVEKTLRVAEAKSKDAERGVARVDPAMMESMELTAGDLIQIAGKRKTTAIVWPGYAEDAEKGILRIDGNMRRNAGTSIDERVSIKKIEAREARKITFAPTEPLRIMGGEEYLGQILEGRAVTRGDIIQINVMGRKIDLVVVNFAPTADATIINRKTEVKISEKPVKEDQASIPKVTYEDIGGLEEEVKKVREMIELPLRHPELFERLGVEAPKGVLLHGPPGTGKTLLAKAVASETNANFMTIGGPEIMSKYHGESEEHLREIFKQAQENAPTIIFIDEIDAIGAKRHLESNNEKDQTLNQLLVEMDGFNDNSGVIVMAATNRVDILDPAILRPGRFDRKVLVGRPDVKGRKEILEVHAKNKPIGDDVDLEQIARITSGFTGADLENLLNEASILAAKAGKHFLTQAEINQAMIKVGIGKEKKSRIISEKEKRITAYHESGHAILFHVLPDVGPVHTVSVIPTGAGAAGYTMPLPGKDEMFLTKGKMLQEIMVDLGGRIAEELILDDITTGASQDIKQATATAKSMVTKYGFSDKLGLINYDDESDDVFIGRDLAHSKGYGENTASVIDEEVREIVDTCYKKAKKIIEDHMEQLHASAALLMEKEKIGREEFESLFDADNNQADSLTNEETV